MQKISSITDTADSDGEFTDGNVAGGVSPTILPAAWFNTIQRELVNLVQGGGLTLDSANDAQILAAIQAVNIGQFISSNGTTGYTKLPNGLIIQWGQGTVTMGSSGSNGLYEGGIILTFPLAFTTTGFQVIPSCADVTGVGEQEHVWVSGKAMSQAAFIASCATAGATMTVYYIAIGK